MAFSGVNPASAFALMVDHQGRKWVGTYDSAVESFDDDVSPPGFTHYTHADALDERFDLSGQPAAGAGHVRHCRNQRTLAQYMTEMA